MQNFVSHIATIEIPVSDLERSIAFYREIFGVSVHFHGEKAAMLTFEAKGVPTIFLVETGSEGKLSFHNTYTGIDHTVVDFYTESLEEFRDWLKGKNVEVGPLNVHPENGMGGFGFKDPDGNNLSACNVLHPGQ
jgi:catechol 2,3-dioxygenase-like lactoylglutathione lyase family enzyme